MTGFLCTMWSALPDIYLTSLLILLTLSTCTISSMSAAVGPSTDEHQGGNEQIASQDVPQDVPQDGASKGAQPCWETENFTPLGPCAQCHALSLKVLSDACHETGFNQLVRCTESNVQVYKSCPRSIKSIERTFWIFEGVTFFIGLFFSFVVFVRRRKLNNEATERVRKQISNSV